MVKHVKRHIALIFTLLLLGGIANEAWAAKVTYHILTLPIPNPATPGNYNYHMRSIVYGHRLEAVKVVVDNQTTVELPAHYKSPLATGFTYYATSQINIGSKEKLYENNSNTYGKLYDVIATPTATPEGTPIEGNTAEYYVVYTYNTSNTVAKLDGSVSYNIGIKGKGYLAYNRGRNNRPAVVPSAKVDAEMLASPDFMKIESPGGGISTYWSSKDNKNKQEDVESQFHFIFKFEGQDPYNIIIRNTYNRNITYIEKNEGTSNFVYKWYKESSLFTVGINSNAYFASDEHRIYNTPWVEGSPNPENLSSESKPGYFHGQSKTICSSFALLNNSDNSGYVFMSTRATDTSGNAPGPDNNNKYYYLKFDNNNLTINRLTAADSTKTYSTEGIYPIKNVNFKVKTPFYALASTDLEKAAHTVTATAKLSQYTLADGSIDPAFIPAELRRKYCNFTTFRDKDGKAITKYKDAYNAETGEYDIFVDYEVQNAPFTAITPKSTYTEAELKAASWYELTDDGSTEASGKKIDYVSSNFKNNGASGAFNKTSEFAFIGDPYELRVISRSQTSGGTPSYVGAATTSNGTDFTASTTASAGYLWEMPYDATVGSFRLRIFSANCSGEGYWSWATGNVSVAVTYGTDKTVEEALTSNPQTITLNVSGLTYADGNYLTAEAGGTDASQVESISVGIITSDGTATITATIAGNTSGENKTFKLTITEKTQGGATVGTATDVDFTQGTSAYAGGNVEYNATATRVKVLPLPIRTYTYKIVDRAGRIAVTASASQTIYSPLSLASIPSIIISPFIVDETITFYDTYSGGGRGNLSGAITETPSANAPIYVKYTTTRLNVKPFKLSEDQEIFVRLNGEYIYYDAGTIKSSEGSVDNDGYKWKLRGQDPYAMLIDNLGARSALSASGSESVTVPIDDEGTTDSRSRQVGAWVDVATITDAGALSFTTTRADAQQFIAKSSARAGVYEVMVATGDGVDASTTYYNIGRPDATTVKIYSNATYQATDDDQIKFRLEENVKYTYHLIDKAKHELLTVESMSPELVLPAEYQSPLVGAANYSYYDISQFDVSGEGANAVYTLKGSPVRLTNISSLLATFESTVMVSSAYDALDENKKLEASTVDDMEAVVKTLTAIGHYYYKVGSDYYDIEVTKPRYLDIYVTYEKNNLVTFNDNSSPYLLKFLVPHAGGYYLEDGADKLTTGKIEAVYPYTNGDGNLNIYGTEMNREQMDGGASTRPRWVWFFESDNSDPYHVKIHSKSTISYNGVSYPTYLQTYAVHFNQDASSTDYHIVTGGVLTGIASINPTEYMVLGTAGRYRLLTTNPVSVDLNGDGDTSDAGESVGERQYVTSFEQYWKTYNMIKQHVLEINVKTDANYKDAFSNDESTWKVPEAVRETLNTKLAAKGLGVGSGSDQWHSYDAYANATRWNGYNDKESGHEKKVVEELEHWFQTFDMGTQGTFDIISADIPPVLVLLDRHGWEIMRKPLPKISSYPSGDELDALRVYDSPMVKEYKFYSNATKASGCHKYSLRMQNGAERDQIKVNGVHYTSTSLADLPPKTASGVVSSGALNDQFVTYTVKDEYEESFTYNFVDHGNNTFTESGTASKFVMLQNKRFYKHSNDGKESYITKPIYEFTNPEGGNVYDLILSPRNASVSEVESGGKLTDYCKWYVMPNLNIDKEMGIKYATTSGGSGEPLTEYETKKNYFETGKGGFDPYNIQLKNAGTGTFLTSHMTSTALSEGAMKGTYDSGTDAMTTRITLETEDTSYPDPELSTGSTGYDHTNIAMTNQTFMAVSDVNGNMQLMPRFDHSKRVNVPTNKISDALLWSTTLEDPVDHAKANIEDNNSMGPQTIFFVRSQVFTYRIIDNDGNEALRYKRSGDYYPTITEHFKSPLATDFKFYYDHAAYTSFVSSEAAYTAAATSAYFQKTVTTDADLTTAAKALTVVDDYYFKVGASAPFIYKKVTVTKAHSGSDDATYTTTDCTETDWTNALVHKGERVANLAALQTAVDNLEVAGNYYYEIGPYVKDAVNTYIYRKIVVKSGKSDFLADVAAKRDVSDKEITGYALAEFDFDADEGEVFVRYSYDENRDKEGDKILLGKWFTVKLNNLDVKSGDTETIVTTDNPATVEIDEKGTGVSLLQGTVKPNTITATDKTWQWKFLVAPIDLSSDLHKSPDPYAIQIFNRNANYATTLDESSPMSVPIKVNGKNRFSLLNHPNGGYALAVNGLESTIDYKFLNGANMSTSVAATTYSENRQKITVDNESAYNTARAALRVDGEYYYKYGDNYKKVIVTSGTPDGGTTITGDDWAAGDTYSFTIKENALSLGTQLVLNDDVTHNYNYSVINNGGSDYVVANPGYLAIEATQNDEAASDKAYAPYLPVEAQTELLNADEDYLYYGSATKDDKKTIDTSDDTYTVATTTKLFTLYGLYDDQVYVRYNKYDPDKGEYEVPNKRNAKESATVARDPGSHDVALNIQGGLPYNIIWYDNNMMSTVDEDATTITDGDKQDLSGLKKYVWYFEGNDPYALKIKHKLTGNYVNGTTTLTDEAGAMQFMLLKKSGYDYGVLQVMGTTGANVGKKLTGYGGALTADASTNPTKFIIFGLSVHDLIYRLIIAKTCANKTSPESDEYVDIPSSDENPEDPNYNSDTKKLRVYGTTQRDLESIKDENAPNKVAGDKYQLGETISWGGANHTYSFDAGTVSIGDLLEVPSVFYRPNCTFDFYIEGIYNTGGTTSESDLDAKYKGLKRKNLMSDSELIGKTVVVNIVYQFDQTVATNTGLGFVTSTDQNLWYTFETNESTPYLARYTNSQNLTAVSGKTTRYTNDYLFTPLGDVYGFKMYNRYVLKNSNTANGRDESKVMTTTTLAANSELDVAVPGANGYEVYELLKGDLDGYFRVHPVVNYNNGVDPYTALYVNVVDNKLKLSTTPRDWTYGLDIAMLQPYYLGAGNVGGLTTTPKSGSGKSGKELYEEALAKEPFMITDLQAVVYDFRNIVDFETGYYRLHSQPGISGISPVRYASGYLHDREKTAGDESTAIPMHFYSKTGVTGTFDGDTNPLKSGFTQTNATRGDIPVPATEADPSTIFYVNGTSYDNKTISDVTLSTQGLNVIENKMGTGVATTYRLIDIGGGVVILVNSGNYLNFTQTTTPTSTIYDLKYSTPESTRLDDVKWCMEPANSQGLEIAVNNGGDDYYYATFCAPFDVALPDDDGDKKYAAYICKQWHDEGVHPVPVPACTVDETDFEEGKYVPAGTPVIIRVKDESGSIQLTLPSSNPSASPVSGNIFSGKYLEQLLDGGAGNEVYTLGLPFTSTVTKDEGYSSSGEISAPLPKQASSGVGFYINATPNKEVNASEASWKRNNRYVLHNKIYYRAPGGGGASAPSHRAIEFVPVIFDDDNEGAKEGEGSSSQVFDGCVYNLQGRCVATEQEVKEGTWREKLAPGVYILNGKKLVITRK